MNRRGLTVLEMLIALAIVVLATAAVTRAYTGSIKFQSVSAESRERHNAAMRFEDEMTHFLEGADIGGGTAYFVSPVPQSVSGIEQQAGDSPLGSGSSSVVFTTAAEPISNQYLTAQETDFQALNKKYGTVGGEAEVAYSMVPVGDAGLKKGLFMREQTPPDDDLTQGGQEHLANDQVKDIRFEFYDGTDWQTTWDTRDPQKGKLPSAIRVTYLLLGEKSPRQFFVRLPMSFLAPGATQAPAASSSGGTGS